MTTSKKVDVEQYRAENYTKAREDWDRLTSKEEWPEEEHQQRFDALMRCAIFMKPRRK